MAHVFHRPLCSLDPLSRFPVPSPSPLQFRKLAKESSGMVEIRVVRGGREVAVKVDEVLAGDLVLVDTGAKLPADGLLLRGSDFKANESA